ncbi:hypothetical protein DFH09DRAFT_1424831 [Mycena vulgaris]|nr:hypothetical protein DFH09DRAFT_1424831 [Mycena vulgaris]
MWSQISWMLKTVPAMVVVRTQRPVGAEDIRNYKTPAQQKEPSLNHRRWQAARFGVVVGGKECDDAGSKYHVARQQLVRNAHLPLSPFSSKASKASVNSDYWWIERYSLRAHMKTVGSLCPSPPMARDSCPNDSTPIRPGSNLGGYPTIPVKLQHVTAPAHFKSPRAAPVRLTLRDKTLLRGMRFSLFQLPTHSISLFQAFITFNVDIWQAYPAESAAFARRPEVHSKESLNVLLPANGPDINRLLSFLRPYPPSKRQAPALISYCVYPDIPKKVLYSGRSTAVFLPHSELYRLRNASPVSEFEHGFRAEPICGGFSKTPILVSVASRLQGALVILNCTISIPNPRFIPSTEAGSYSY